MLRRWGSSIKKVGFNIGVDNLQLFTEVEVVSVNWPPYRDSKS